MGVRLRREAKSRQGRLMYLNDARNPSAVPPGLDTVFVHANPGSELPGYNQLSLRDNNDVLIGFFNKRIPTWALIFQAG